MNMPENIVSANEKYAEAIGYDYGPTSNVVQAALLNGFAHSLNIACSRTPDMQLAYVVDGMTDETRAIFKSLGQLIEAADGH